MRNEPNVGLRCLTARSSDTTKGVGSSWKSKPAKEHVATHLPNGLAPKMDGAQAGDRCPTTDMIHFSVQEGVGVVMQPLAQAWANQPLVQILVVVANIQMRTLKAEVEKGSM